MEGGDNACAELIVSARVVCSPSDHTHPPTKQLKEIARLLDFVLVFIAILVDLTPIKVQYATAIHCHTSKQTKYIMAETMLAIVVILSKLTAMAPIPSLYGYSIGREFTGEKKGVQKFLMVTYTSGTPLSQYPKRRAKLSLAPISTTCAIIAQFCNGNSRLLSSTEKRPGISHNLSGPAIKR